MDPDDGWHTAPVPRLLACAVGALLLVPIAACSGDDASGALTERERATDTDVPFSECGDAECTGELDGAAYEIVMPETWNGTLLLYSHGYRQAEPAPPDFEEPSREAEPAPGWWSGGQREVGQALLDQGYAIAGSAYSSNGWAVADGVSAGEQLYEQFVEQVGRPDRVYAWGDSLGGLVTQVLAERHPDWVTGAAPLCAVLGGPVANLDLALDVAYGVKTLIHPDLQLTGFESWDDGVQEWQSAADAAVTAGSDVTAGVPRLLLVAALADAPSQTATYDGSTVESQVRAKVESLLTALGFGTFSRYEIEERFGGNPSTNAGVDYDLRVDDEERSLIDTVGGAGTTDALLAQLDAGERVEADEDARTAFAESGTPSGAVQDPTVLLHTTADPLVIVQNEALFDARARDNAERTSDYVQLYSLPPASYTPEEGAPYGGGHCNFTVGERVGVIALLDDWARNGVYPAPPAVERLLPVDTGVTTGYRPGAWPASEVG